MKRGTVRHPKLKRLARRLNLDPWAAMGLLETLLDWAHQFARHGDVGRHADEDIAEGIGWTGDAGALIAALVGDEPGRGWLDRCTVNRLVIHDLEDHADDAWRKAVARSGRPFATAVPPTLSTDVAPLVGQCPDTDRTPSVVQPTLTGKKRTCQARPGQEGTGQEGKGTRARENGTDDGTEGHGLILHPVPDLEPFLALVDRLGERDSLKRDAERVGCLDLTACIPHWHAKRRSTRAHQRHWRTDWIEDLRAWLLDHPRYGGPCQARTTSAAAPRQSFEERDRAEAERRTAEIAARLAAEREAG